MNENGKHGFLKIGNDADHVTVASILYKNGYTVSPVRKKSNGKTFEYYVEFDMKPKDMAGDDAL